MSTDTERVEEPTETSLLESWEDWYHVPVVVVAILFMFWTRVRNYDAFVTEDGSPALAGVDSWYHWRTFQWTAENYPQTMPYEIWTSFPTGKYVGQFGTLFDQLVVTAAMIAGLGDPSTETLYMTALFVVPAFAALVAVPVFFAGRRLGGTLGGVVSVVLLALVPGSFFQRTTTGQFDHHGAEVLFMAIAVLAMMVALRVAEREKPIWELVEGREWEALKPSATYSVLAGIALTLYIWVWPSGIMLIGIFGAFFVVQLCLDYLRGVSPDHVAFVGAISLGVTAVASVLLFEEPGTSVTSFGYLQPALAGLIAAGCLFVAWLARQWSARGLERTYFPGAVAGLIVAALAVLAIAVPELFDTIVNNVTQRILPFGAEEGASGTIQEASPPGDFAQHVFDEYGMAFYTMLVGLALLVVRPFLDREFRTESVLILVWSLFLISMGMTQIRFAYYLLLPVVVVNAVFVGEVVRLLDIDRVAESVRSIEVYQAIAILLIVSMLFVPLIPPIQDSNVVATGGDVQPHSEAQTWEEATHWMNANTPESGNWAGANNASELDLYGAYERPSDGDFEYPEGAYGVMSWWDYGHLITVQGERMPHANPFQSNAASASAYLQADSEELGEATLDVIAAGEDPSDMSEEEILSRAEEVNSTEEMRYVMIDDAMVGGKFSAITEWAGPGYGTYLEQTEYDYAGQDQALPTTNENFENSMMASLYLDDANGMEGYRLVHENDDYSVVGGMLLGQTPLPTYSRSLGIEWGEQAQLTQFSLAQSRQQGAVNQELGIPLWDAHLVSSVKSFERVEGATLTGSVTESVADNATVTAGVTLQTDPGRTFTYSQETTVAENGSFELTVPYPTEEELGPEDGYTNSSVRATDDFQVGVFEDGNQTLEGNASVPETAVVEGEEIDVELSEYVPEDDAENGTENGTDGAPDGDATDGGAVTPDDAGSTDVEAEPEEAG